MRLEGGCRGRGDIPGVGNIAKLSMSKILRLSRDLGLQIPRPPRHPPRLQPDDADALTEPAGNRWPSAVTEWRCSPRRRRSTAAPTRSSATSSASGCSASRRSPSNDKVVPFKDLPKNG